MELSELPAFSPLTFFAMQLKASYARELTFKTAFKEKYRLPSLEGLVDHEIFADLSLAWNEDELIIAVQSKQAFEESTYPSFSEGDSLECFIDTRDLKNVNAPTRFCHHFFFLPEPFENIQCGEITRLRADQTRPLADPGFIAIECEFGKSQYKMIVKINREALCGYDPTQLPKIGFGYRLNRPSNEPQIFGSEDFKIENHPSLWASIELIP